MVGGLPAVLVCGEERNYLDIPSAWIICNLSSPCVRHRVRCTKRTAICCTRGTVDRDTRLQSTLVCTRRYSHFCQTLTCPFICSFMELFWLNPETKRAIRHSKTERNFEWDEPVLLRICGDSIILFGSKGDSIAIINRNLSKCFTVVCLPMDRFFHPLVKLILNIPDKHIYSSKDNHRLGWLLSIRREADRSRIFIVCNESALYIRQRTYAGRADVFSPALVWAYFDSAKTLCPGGADINTCSGTTYVCKPCCLQADVAQIVRHDNIRRCEVDE